MSHLPMASSAGIRERENRVTGVIVCQCWLWLGVCCSECWIERERTSAADCPSVSPCATLMPDHPPRYENQKLLEALNLTRGWNGRHSSRRYIPCRNMELR